MKKDRPLDTSNLRDIKLTRPKMDDELVSQLERTREVVKTLNIPVFSLEGFEADDVLGTLVVQAESLDFEEIIIVTGDKDALQLLTPKIHVYFPSRGKQLEKIIYPKNFLSKNMVSSRLC